MLKITFRAFAVATIVGTGISACGQDTSDEAYLARATSYMSEGKLKASEIELKNALKENPGNMAARKALGELYFKVGDVPAAEKELLRVYESPQADQFADLRPMLARVQLGLNRYADIESIPLDNLEGEYLATLLGAQALAFLADGDNARAKQRITQALSADPDAGFALYASAKVQAMDNQFDAALLLLDRVIQEEPEFYQALSFKGDILRSLNRSEEAVAVYTQSLEKNQGLVADRYKRALTYVSLGDLKAAQKDVNKLLAQNAQNPAVNFAQGLVHFYEDRYEDAVSSFVIAESEKFRFPNVSLYLGVSHWRLGNFETALGYARDFHDTAPGHEMGNKLLAALLLNQSKAAEAETLLRQFLERDPDDVDGLNLLANSLVAQRRTDEALDYLARIVELNPNSEEAQVRFTAGLANTGKTDEAIKQADMALEMNPEFAQADMVKVLTYIRANDLDKALEAARAYRKKKPVDASPQLLLGRVYVARKEIQKAVEAYNKAAELDPGSPAANNALAGLAVSQGDYNKAKEYFGAILKADPDHLQSKLALAGVEANLGNEKAMLDRLEKAAADHPKAGQPKLLIAQYYLEKNEPNRALNQLTTLTSAEAASPLTLRLKARIQLALGNPAEARALMIQLLREVPNSGKDHALIAKTYLALGNESKQHEHLRKAIELAPKEPSVRYEMGLRALRDRNLPLLSEQLAVLDEIAPDTTAVRQLRAAKAGLEGKPEEALRVLQKLHKDRPSSMSVLNVARQLTVMQRKEEGTALLTNWLSENNRDITVRLSLAESLLRENKVNDALVHYKTALEHNPDNVIALNNLAWFLREEQPQLALEYALKANNLVKNSPPLMDTLAVVQAQNKQFDRAMVTIREALRLEPGVPVMEYRYAQIQHQKGDNAAAVKSLRELLKKHEKFPERKEAQALLEKLAPQ